MQKSFVEYLLGSGSNFVDHAKAVPATISGHIPNLRALARTLPGYDEDNVSDAHLAFVFMWFRTNDEKAAAAQCGFHLEQLEKLTNREIHIQLFRQLLLADMRTNGMALAVRTIKEVMNDRGAPAAARTSAARTMKEWVEEAEQASLPEGFKKSLGEMTIEELSAVIHNLEQAEQLSARTIDATPQDSGGITKA